VESGKPHQTRGTAASTGAPSPSHERSFVVTPSPPVTRFSGEPHAQAYTLIRVPDEDAPTAEDASLAISHAYRDGYAKAQQDQRRRLVILALIVPVVGFVLGGFFYAVSTWKASGAAWSWDGAARGFALALALDIVGAIVLPVMLDLG
jgi:hypothetical protein